MKINFLFIFLLLNARCLFSQNPCPNDSIIYDGVIYHTIAIGNQCWLKENLNNGIMIDSSLDQENNLIIEKYCYSNNPANGNVYGGLYQWDEMMQYSVTNGVQGICPDGWHIPTDLEWYELEHYTDSSIKDPDFVGSRGITAGFDLQVGGSSGLDILCAGQNYGYGFNNVDYAGYYWSSTEVPNSGICVIGGPNCFAYHRRFFIEYPWIEKRDNTGFTQRPKAVGMSVRCVYGTGISTSDDEEKSIKKTINIYPNPCNELLNVEINKNNEDVRICIFDIYGKLVMGDDHHMINNSISINVSNLSGGLYCISVSTLDENIVKNFIINK